MAIWSAENSSACSRVTGPGPCQGMRPSSTASASSRACSWATWRPWAASTMASWQPDSRVRSTVDSAVARAGPGGMSSNPAGSPARTVSMAVSLERGFGTAGKARRRVAAHIREARGRSARRSGHDARPAENHGRIDYDRHHAEAGHRRRSVLARHRHRDAGVSGPARNDISAGELVESAVNARERWTPAVRRLSSSANHPMRPRARASPGGTLSAHSRGTPRSRTDPPRRARDQPASRGAASPRGPRCA
jgi:hypothetical protein